MAIKIIINYHLVFNIKQITFQIVKFYLKKILDYVGVQSFFYSENKLKKNYCFWNKGIDNK